MQWPAIWWIFPLAGMVLMVVMCLFMVGAGGMRCMPRMGRMDKRDLRGGGRGNRPMSRPRAATPPTLLREDRDREHGPMFVPLGGSLAPRGRRSGRGTWLQHGDERAAAPLERGAFEIEREAR